MGKLNKIVIVNKTKCYVDFKSTFGTHRCICNEFICCMKFQLRIFSRNLDLETSPLKTELIFEMSKYVFTF